MKNQTGMDRLVELISQRCFHGVLPPYPEIICAAVVKCVPCVRDADEVITQRFADELYAALRSRLQARKSADETEFLN